MSGDWEGNREEIKYVFARHPPPSLVCHSHDHLYHLNKLNFSSKKHHARVGIKTCKQQRVRNLKAHVHQSGFVRLSFCFGTVHLLNAVFWLAVVSQVTISNYAKFPQCIQGDNGPLILFARVLFNLSFWFFYRLVPKHRQIIVCLFFIPTRACVF